MTSREWDNLFTVCETCQYCTIDDKPHPAKFLSRRATLLSQMVDVWRDNFGKQICRFILQTIVPLFWYNAVVRTCT